MKAGLACDGLQLLGDVVEDLVLEGGGSIRGIWKSKTKGRVALRFRSCLKLILEGSIY